MLSKSFALFAAFAAFAPAFAAPVPTDAVGVTAIVDDIAKQLNVGVLTQRSGAPTPASVEEVVELLIGSISNSSLQQRDNGCSVAEVNAIVKNILNNGEIDILTQSKRGGCDVVGVTAQVKDILNDLHISILTQSKRSEGYCSVADIAAIVTDVANDMNISVLSQSKRSSSSCDVVKVTAIVQDLLKNLDVKVLTQSKRSTYSVGDITTNVENILNDVTTTLKARSETEASLVGVTVDHVLSQINALNGNSKRSDVDVQAVVMDVLNDANLSVTA